MNGLYALKPWYAGRLAGVRRVCVARRVDPDVLSWSTALFGAAAGLVVTTGPGIACAAGVSGLLALRLAATNLDGAVARERGVESPRGALVGEVTDRLADLAALAGLAAHLRLSWVLLVLLCCCAPSWVSLARTASGLGPRVQGGPVGKTERCLLLVVACATGLWLPVAGAIALGSLVTALLRAVR